MSFAWNIGGILMDTMTPDSDGVIWSAALTGWDTPDTVESWTQKSNDDGAFRAPAFSTFREVTATIWADAPDADTMQRCRLKFAATFEPNADVVIQSIETVPWFVTGNRSGKLFMSHPQPAQMSANLLVRCKDPLKYGPSQTVRIGQAGPPPGLILPAKFPLLIGNPPSGYTINNPGPHVTPPVIQFFGPIQGPFWLANRRSNKKIQYSLDLRAGDVLTVNTKIGSVLINGSTGGRTFQSLDSQIWKLEKGDNQIEFGTNAVTSGYVNVTYAPASMG